MTFDREPDLDNANVGMPCRNRRFMRKLTETGASFFVAQDRQANGCLHTNSFVKKGKILLRLHPSENFEKKRQLFKDDENLILSQGTSLYDDIVNSRVVISWASTCVYEIMAFGKTPVIIDSVLSREGLSQDIGIWINGPADLLSMNMDDLGQVKDATWYWKDSFESNVKSYMENCHC